MVQTKDQYVLVHKAVRELFLEHMKIIDSHPYENVDFAGLPVALKVLSLILMAQFNYFLFIINAFVHYYLQTCHDYENLTVEDVMKEPDEGE